MSNNDETAFGAPNASDPTLDSTALPEIIRRGAIKTIGDAVGANGRAYKVVEFADGKKVNIFNPHYLEGIMPGDQVEYHLKKTARGYWDVTNMQRAEEPPASSDVEAPQRPPVPTGQEPAPNADRLRCSTNALANATSLVSTLIANNVVKPPGVDEVIALVKHIYQELIKKVDLFLLLPIGIDLTVFTATKLFTPSKNPA